MNTFESAGLTVLEFLAPVIASLAAAKNPAYGALISAGGSVIQNELVGLQNGQPLTLHTAAPAIETGIAGATTAVLANNPQHAAAITAVGQALLNAVAAANQPAPTATATATATG